MHFFTIILVLGIAVVGYVIQYLIMKAAVRNGTIEAHALTQNYNYHKIIKEAVRDGILAADEQKSKPGQQ